MRASSAPRALCTRSPLSSPAGKASRRGYPEPARPPRRARQPPRRCQGPAQKFTARPGPKCRPRSRAPAFPSPAALLRRSPDPRSRRRGGERTPARRPPQCAQPAPPPHSAQRPTRDARSSTLRARGLRWAAGRGGDHPPDGIASSHHALTCAAHSTGVAGRPCREVTAAQALGREGVLPGACPPSHLPPSLESPRAGPRAHQCARAAPSSTAGGGGAVGAVGAVGGWAGEKVPAGARQPARRRAPGPQLHPALTAGGGGLAGHPLAGRGVLRGEALLPGPEPRSFL